MKSGLDWVRLGFCMLVTRTYVGTRAGYVTLNIPACTGYPRQMLYLRNWLSDNVLKSTYFNHNYKQHVHASIRYTWGAT